MTNNGTSSEFPQFEDADVSVVVSTSRIYKLHAHVLRRVSSYFRNVFETIESPRLTAAARREGYTAWRFQLYQDHTMPNDRGSFAPLQISESGRVCGQNFPPRGPNMTVGGEDNDKCWDWLFGCFYGITPELDSSTFGATVNDCFVLIDCADTIGASDHVREVVDLALMRQDEVLWKSIAGSPTVWAELGRRVRSPTIFKEAVIHIVGKWKMLDAESKEQLPKDIRELCKKKWEELELAKRAIEIRIAGHYPPFLCRNHADKPHRTAYASDIYSWMALSYFRQYLSQSGSDSLNRMAEDGGYAWYKSFAQAGDAYLNHEDMRTFHTFFPMSSKACSVLEAHMNVLKEDIKDFVKDLMVVRTHVDPATLEGVSKPWLTCTVVERDDLSWVVPEGREEQGLNDLAQQAMHIEESGTESNEEDNE